MRRLGSLLATTPPPPPRSDKATAAALEDAYLRALCSNETGCDPKVRANILLSIKFIIGALANRVGESAAQAVARTAATKSQQRSQTSSPSRHSAGAKPATVARSAFARSDSAAAAAKRVLQVVCQTCHRPLTCQASLEILRNEAVVHEVGVTEGTLQVKMDAAGVPEAATQVCNRTLSPMSVPELSGIVG